MNFMNLMKADWKIRGIVLMISSIIWPVLGIYLKFFSRLGAISGSNDFLVFMVLAGIISFVVGFAMYNYANKK